MQKQRKTSLGIEKVEIDSCENELRLNTIRQLPFFKNLSDGALKKINKLFNDAKYKPKDIIYFSGDKATRLCVIASGSVKLIKHSVNGSDTVVDILRKGEFFGNLDPIKDAVYQETAVVKTSSCIMKIATEDFRNILKKYPDAAIKIIDILSERLRETQESVAHLSAHSIEYRIAYTLLKLDQKLAEEKKSGDLTNISLTRNDLANMIGTTSETVSRIISRLHKKGIVFSGRKCIAIKDVNRLKKKLELG